MRLINLRRSTKPTSGSLPSDRTDPHFGGGLFASWPPRQSPGSPAGLEQTFLLADLISPDVDADSTRIPSRRGLEQGGATGFLVLDPGRNSSIHVGIVRIDWGSAKMTRKRLHFATIATLFSRLQVFLTQGRQFLELLSIFSRSPSQSRQVPVPGARSTTSGLSSITPARQVSQHTSRTSCVLLLKARESRRRKAAHVFHPHPRAS
jgi:hypothetical protein